MLRGRHEEVQEDLDMDAETHEIVCFCTDCIDDDHL
jgi:hypothetical protein